MNNKPPYIKGRGAQINPANRFHHYVYDENPVDWELEEEATIKTDFIEVSPKTILNKVKSPDIPNNWSMNPYQGCEHGCIYCYARNSHNYWGYSAGLDFETKILVKKSAPQLLEAQLKKKSWKASPVSLSGNTDCYQPIEKQLEITRKILEVFWKYRHPVSIITKNSLILRDLDILQDLAAHHLVHTAISITTLDDNLRRFLEPRTASIAQRLKTVETLASHGVPVMVMMAPVIPGLNDMEILGMAKKVADLGAYHLGHTIVRLEKDVAMLFEDWLRKNMPHRAEKVLNKIKSCHGGQLYSTTFKTRMTGQGSIAKIINDQFRLANQRYFKDRHRPPYNLDLHEQFKSPQLRLF